MKINFVLFLFIVTSLAFLAFLAFLAHYSLLSILISIRSWIWLTLACFLMNKWLISFLRLILSIILYYRMFLVIGKCLLKSLNFINVRLIFRLLINFLIIDFFIFWRWKRFFVSLHYLICFFASSCLRFLDFIIMFILNFFIIFLKTEYSWNTLNIFLF